MTTGVFNDQAKLSDLKQLFYGKSDVVSMERDITGRVEYAQADLTGAEQSTMVAPEQNVTGVTSDYGTFSC